jgi:putative ABC transport system permease protein
MIKSYFNIAWRNLVRDPKFSLLNLTGLASGLATVLLIFLWVNDERNIDKFNRNDSQLFQVLKTAPNADGSISVMKHTQGLLAKSMAADFPEIEYAVSVRKEEEKGILSAGDKHIKANWEFVDKDFLHVFSYVILEGDSNNFLPDKYSVLLSDKLALKLFHTTDNLVGKTVAWDVKEEFKGLYKIAGIFKSPPANATDQFDILFPYSLFVEKEIGGMGDVSFWGSNMSQTYIRLKKGTEITRFNSRIRDYTKSKIKVLYKDQELAKWEGDLFVQHYSDRYLYGRYENGVQAGGRIEYVRLFTIIAIFILVIACINFMNLTTAKASRRFKEVGIRKVVGAGRGTLILQYMGEALLMSFLSLGLAALFVWLLLPAFREITGKQLPLYLDAKLIFSVWLITCLTGLFAGSYPAIYLSGFRPALVLKGRLISPVGESWIRKGLVVFQFTISAILIISVLVIYGQMHLIQTKNLGYQKDNIVWFSNEGNPGQTRSGILNEIRKLPGVLYAAGMEGDMLGNAGHSGGGISWEGKDPGLGIEYYGIGAGYDLTEMLGLRMKLGRSFSRSYGNDSSKVIFNEAAIQAMGIKEPVGKTVSLWGEKKQIIGIVADFHFESLYKKVGPLFFYYTQNNNRVLVKIKAGREKETLAKLDQLYKTYNQGLPFEYRFLDEDYEALYASEQRVSVLSRYFAGMAIIISCLGLFGLAAFTVQKRQKEISIRKVVGASANHIALLLSKEFLKLVLVSLLLAFPIAWWVMGSWLRGFAYRVHLGAGVFLITGFSVLFITIITVGTQALKSAYANPAKSIRAE